MIRLASFLASVLFPVPGRPHTRTSMIQGGINIFIKFVMPYLLTGRESMKEILKILEKDARVSTEEIATMTGMKKAEVEKEIKKMEKEGIILRYKTVVNWEKAGEEMVYALIDVNVTPKRGRGYDAFAERIYRFPEVKTLYLVSGAYDLAVLVGGRTMKEVASFVAEKLAPLDQVRGTTTHFLLKKYKEDGEIFHDKEESKRLAISP